jgi:hypothetical protein
LARKAVIDKDLLAMALVGYQAEIARIEAAIADLKARMGGQLASSPAPTPPGKRTLSASARRRIAAAQKKRWAVIKNVKATPEKPKRKMSAAARKRIGDATRKRWADLRKATGKKAKKHPKAKLNGGGGAGGAGGGGSKP